MNKISLACSIFALSMTLPAQAFAEVPFGIGMGTRITDLAIRSDSKDQFPGEVYLENVPSPSPYFLEYSAFVTLEQGVCNVVGTTPIISRLSTDVIPYLEYFAYDFGQKYGDVYLINDLEASDEVGYDNLPSVGKKNFTTDDLIANFTIDGGIYMMGKSEKYNLEGFYLETVESDDGIYIEAYFSFTNESLCEEELESLYQ